MTDQLQETDRDAWLDAWLVDEPDGTLPRIVRQLRADLAAAKAKAKYHVPGPYEIALAVGAALVGSGRYETPGAAMVAAWMAVPEFYAGRDTYVRELAPIMFAMGGGDAITK